MSKNEPSSIIPLYLSLAFMATIGFTFAENRTPVGVANLFTKSGKEALAAKVDTAMQNHYEQRIPLMSYGDEKERAWKIDMGYDQNETLIVGGNEIGKLPQSIYWVDPIQHDATATPLMTQKEAIEKFISIHEQLTESAKKAIISDWYPDTKIVRKDTQTGFTSDIFPIDRNLTFGEVLRVGNGRVGIAATPWPVNNIGR